MKIAIVGAAGWIGNEILNQAQTRGHQVIALVRDPGKVSATEVETRIFDVTNVNNSLAEAVAGADVIISSISGRHDGDQSIFRHAAQRYLSELIATATSRLIWVGGAGSLEVTPGVELVTTADFPPEYKAEALGQSEALTVFKQSNSALNWTYISPAALIYPGDTEGPYRVTQDQLLTDAEGNSKISVSDYVTALIDELEQAKYPRQRIGIAY